MQQNKKGRHLGAPFTFSSFPLCSSRYDPERVLREGSLFALSLVFSVTTSGSLPPTCHLQQRPCHPEPRFARSGNDRAACRGICICFCIKSRRTVFFRTETASSRSTGGHTNGSALPRSESPFPVRRAISPQLETILPAGLGSNTSSLLPSAIHPRRTSCSSPALAISFLQY
jgi:hypothetical protein